MIGAVASAAVVAAAAVAAGVGVYRATRRRRDRYWAAHDAAGSSRDTGASAVEYGLLIAAVAAVLVGTVFALGGVLKTTFGTVSTSIQACIPDPTCPAP